MSDAVSVTRMAHMIAELFSSTVCELVTDEGQSMQEAVDDTYANFDTVVSAALHV